MQFKYDIAVVGGGPGGFGAAVAAARSGAKVLLLDREGCLGGAAIHMLVNPFMRHQTSVGTPGEGGRVVNAGIYAEVLARLDAIGGLNHSDVRFGDFDDEKLKIVYDDMAAEAGVDVIFHATLFDAQAEDGVVKSARFSHNGGIIIVEATIFVDSTGDGVLAAAAGASFMNDGMDGNAMPLTTMFAVGGLDTDRFPDRHYMEKRAAEGIHDDPPLKVGRMGLYRIAPNGLAYFNAVRIIARSLEPQEMSRAEAEGRKLCLDYVRWLRANIEGAENAVLIKTGTHIGVRESRRIQADYIYSADDATSYKHFEDSIACSGYMFDVHSHTKDGSGDRLEPLKPNECLRVPYRSLLPVGLKNLIVACRALGAEALPFSSIRVQPPIMCIGHAAGLAASMSLPSGDLRAIDIATLRQTITEQGGIVE